MISFEEFKKVELKVATILEAEKVEGSDKLVKLQIDLGGDPSAGSGQGLGQRQIVAGIGLTYKIEELPGRQIVIVANLEPKTLMGQESNGMLLAADVNGQPILLVPVKTLLLAGVIVSVFLSALITLIASLKGESMGQIILWLMGNLSEANITLIIIAGFLVLVGLFIAYFFSRDLNIISLGEEGAQHLGVEVEMVKKILFVVTSLITGAVVAITGLIGFVGLIIPHIMRLIVGPDHRVLIIASVLAGGIFLTLADLVGRTIISPAEIPVGVITAIFGGPFFLFLLKRKKEIML